MTEFRYLRANEWGIRWARPPIDERLLDAETYVHHTAGPVPYDAVTAFRALNEFAINTKGYSALDYDVLVHRNPTTGLVTIGGGREGYMSAATLDRNEQGEAICLLGYFHPGSTLSRPPHPDELEGIARAIVWAMGFAWIDPRSVILGHRDNPAHPNATACPGDYLYAELPTIRARVAELLNPEVPTVPTGLPMYFKLPVPGALTVWATTDMLTAVRLDADTCKARGVDPFTVPTLSEHDAGLLVYPGGLPFASVR